MKTISRIASVVLLLTILLAASPAGTLNARAAACYHAQFVADVTVPDKTNFAPNTAFRKTWRIKNIGACAWNAGDVSLIFDSGERMNASTSLGLPSTVLPGQTVDLAVDMVSPNAAGHYFGYWKFKSNTGGVFGIGYSANRSFWVEILVPSSSGAGYDFTANASSAAWSGSYGYIPFPGPDGSAGGFGLKRDQPMMENGITSANAGLLFVPTSIHNGYLQAVYPAIRVQPGDRFQATIGCEYGATHCYVSYSLSYQVGSGPIRTLWTFREKYEGLTYNVNIDLNPLADQEVKFILAVATYGSMDGDRALWVNPIISRANVTPPPANLPDLRISNVYLGMRGIPGSPTTCYPYYEQFEIRVTVLNQGVAPAYNIPVVDLVTGTQFSIGELQPNQTFDLIFPAGGSNYNFVIDPQNTIQETDKNNNKTSYLPITPTPPVLCTPTVTPGPLPDPAITYVSFGLQGGVVEPSGCISGNLSFAIKVVIKNLGQAQALNVPVLETFTGTQLVVPLLPAGQSTELYFPATSPTGRYNVAIDPQNQTPDLDRNNNVYPYVPIIPTPPVICTPTPTPSAQTGALIVWQSIDTPCRTASFWSDRMTYGFCPPSLAPVTQVYTQMPDYTSRFSIWSKAYAPFTAQTPAGTVTFNGSGHVIATPAEQRMIAEWAARMYYDVPAGGPTVADAQVISGHFSADNSCFDIIIFRDGHYILSSCLTGYTYPAPSGYLDANDLLYFYRWMDRLQSFQESAGTGILSFVGNGRITADFAQKISIETMVFILEGRARGQTYASGGGMPLPVFLAQRILAQQLGIPTGEIQVKNIGSVNYPDECLGAYEYYCELVPVTGYRIELIARGLLYEYHTDSVGYNIRQFGGPQPVPQGGG